MRSSPQPKNEWNQGSEPQKNTEKQATEEHRRTGHRRTQKNTEKHSLRQMKNPVFFCVLLCRAVQRSNTPTVSTCGVFGKRSNPFSEASRYPASSTRRASRAIVGG